MKVRETAVNILIGALLLVIFAAICAAICSLFGLSLYALSLAVKHFLPGVSGDVWFFALILFLSISSAIGDLRKRLWPNAFVSLSIVAILFAALLGAATRHDTSWWFKVYPLFLLLLITNGRALRSWELALAGALVVVEILLNAGLLMGTPSRIVEVCTSAGVLAWLVVQIRRGQFAGVSTKDVSQTSV